MPRSTSVTLTCSARNDRPTPKCPKEKTADRIAAVDQSELAFNQPTGAGSLVFFQNAGRSKLLELLFQIAGKFNRCERLADRHFAV